MDEVARYEEWLYDACLAQFVGLTVTELRDERWKIMFEETRGLRELVLQKALAKLGRGYYASTA
jgi:hypothetical protein